MNSPTNISKLRVLIAMGTRPEIIKQAPLVWAARSHPALETIVCHSGQHSDLAAPMLDYFQVKPDIELALIDQFSTLPSLVGGCMQRMEQVFADSRPDVIVVQGDTATTVAISLASFYARLPVVHVEAGLRTGDLQSPWPEELNRRVATLAADLHCAPTRYAMDRLLSEKVDPQKIFLSGNPIVDALQWTLQRESAREPSRNGSSQPGGGAEKRLSLNGQPLVVLTAHRRENFGKPLEDICSAVLELSKRFPDHRFIFVTHPNPAAGRIVRSILDGRSRIEVAPPLSYPEFVCLMRASRLIISDSGGIQEEAPSLAIPLLITRESTERPEAVQCGAAELVGTNTQLLVRRATELLSTEDKRQAMAAASNPFGDGTAGKKIIDEIVLRYGESA